MTPKNWWGDGPEPRPIEEFLNRKPREPEPEPEPAPKRKRRARQKSAKLGMVYARKGVWYVRFRVNGREYRESSKSTDRSVAVAFLEKRRNEVVERKVVGPRVERTRLDDLVELIERDYTANGRRTIKTMQGSVKHLRRVLGDVPPCDITYAMLDDYHHKRKAEGAKAATVKRELAIMSKMFRLAARSGMVLHRPEFPTITVSNTRTGFITQETFDKLVDRLPVEVAAFTLFIYVTGWRIKEVRNLRWTAVDFTEGTIRIEDAETKNATAKTYPFDAHPDLRALMEAQRERVLGVERARGEMVPWVFPRLDGRQMGSFRKVWDRACRQVGVAGRVPYDLKRSAVRNMDLKGVPRVVAMQLAGLKTESIFRRYRIVAEAELREAVSKMGGDRPGDLKRG